MVALHIVQHVDGVLARGAVDLYLDAEEFEDGVAMAEEIALAVVRPGSVVVGRVAPAPVDFLAGDASGRVDGIHQPDESLKELVLCCHVFDFFFGRKGLFNYLPMTTKVATNSTENTLCLKFGDGF